MSYTGRQSINTSNVLSVIMGGGQGTRLFPLTKERSKPAVPLAGKYRLVDIPISNCINSGLATDLHPDPVQLGVPAPAHFPILQIRPFLGWFCGDPGGGADLHGHLLVPGHRRCRAQEHSSISATMIGTTC